MMTVQDAMEAAVAKHRAGKLPEAEAIYRQVLQQHPDYPDALHLLGVIATSVKRYSDAVDLIQRAIKGSPNSPAYYVNLGVALDQLGRLDEAIEAFSKATKLNGQYAQAFSNLGNALGKKGLLAEAIAASREAVRLNPDFPEARNNLGNALQQSGHAEEAIISLRRAVALRPNYVEAHCNMGKSLLAINQVPEAIAELRRAIALHPNFPEAHNNLGSALAAAGEIDQSIQAFAQATRLAPNFAIAHFNLGIMLLLKGNFEQGWPEYEWRLGVAEFNPPVRLKQMPWDGSDLAGRRILLHAEQGLGDVIQFVRYVPEVARRGGKITLLCHADLHRLVRGVEGIDQLITPNAPLGAFDEHCPLASLPRVFKTNLATIPGHTPYLTADAELMRQWQSRIEGDGRFSTGLKVGLVWAGRAAHANDRQRSMRLAELLPLVKCPGVSFFSLQKSEAGKQAASLGTEFPITDWTEEIGDFADAAALVANLDLVITVDTAAAHLAGALGKPVWLMLAELPDWRWMLGRNDSPWYPSMRLFREQKKGKSEGAASRWGETVGQIVEALCTR